MRGIDQSMRKFALSLSFRALIQSEGTLALLQHIHYRIRTENRRLQGNRFSVKILLRTGRPSTAYPSIGESEPLLGFCK